MFFTFLFIFIVNSNTYANSLNEKTNNVQVKLQELKNVIKKDLTIYSSYTPKMTILFLQ